MNKLTSVFLVFSISVAVSIDAMAYEKIPVKNPPVQSKAVPYDPTDGTTDVPGLYVTDEATSDQGPSSTVAEATPSAKRTEAQASSTATAASLISVGPLRRWPSGGRPSIDTERVNHFPTHRRVFLCNNLG